MLYIPILEIVNSSPDIRAKIAFNHKKYTGEEALSSICGLNDLNTPLKLKNGKTVMIRTLLQSIPATEGMSRPQLFQTVEAKFTTLATIVTCQASDQKLVYQWQESLDSELRIILATNEDEKLFLNPEEDLWFGKTY